VPSDTRSNSRVFFALEDIPNPDCNAD